MSETTSSKRAPTTVSLADEEGVKRILVDTVFGLWGMVNNLTRLRPTKRERYRVTIFGSARAQPGSLVYEEVKRLAGEMWADLVAWAQRWMLRPGFELANAEDMAIPTCVQSADGAIEVLSEHHTRWQLRQGSSV